MTRWSPPVALLILTCACTRSASDHEELGDRAYAAADYRSALAEYQLGLKAHAGSASLDAKLGAAALHTQDYFAAAEAYRALARDDRSRVDEAADALERVVRAALGTNDRGALASALTGMREIAPTRPLGRYATLAALDAVERGDTATALALLPVATAASADPARADSLLYLYGMALVRVRDCTTAVSVFEGVIWRKRAPVVVESAREGLGLCALVEGQLALEKGRPADAEDWFRRATAPGASPDVVRAAFLGLGDVRLAQGDIAGALESYQQALVGGTPGDTIAQRAQEKINSLGKAEPQ
ncbi:MAG TPA: tetratricopeptide repeat protein [Gemmatimonadales bacterium]|nr:tetratricopeptide repeat protein [Gemmatimonadales bacterium]